jgi:DNA-binding transcriptional LysR family regulator
VLVEENAYKLEELAEHDKTDITITTLPIQNEQLAYQTLVLDEVVMVVPENFLPSNFNKEKYNNYDKFTYQEIEMSQLRDVPFLLLKQGHRLRQVADEILDAENIKPKIALESISIETLYQLTTIGMGITFIPKSLIPKEDTITDQVPLYFFKLRNSAADFSMVAIYNKYRCLSIAAQKFISLIKEFQ